MKTPWIQTSCKHLRRPSRRRWLAVLSIGAVGVWAAGCERDRDLAEAELEVETTEQAGVYEGARAPADSVETGGALPAAPDDGEQLAAVDPARGENVDLDEQAGADAPAPTAPEPTAAATADAPEPTEVVVDPSAGAGDIRVQQGQPRVRVEQAQPQVTVTQPKPRVSVQQPMPEITVRMPQPVVTVEMPEPQVSVNMPEPNVSVEQATPQVRLEQQQPEIEVEEAEAAVDVVQAEADVRVEQAEGAEVAVERQGEVEIVVEEAEGEPTIVMEEGQQFGSPPPAEGQQPAERASGAEGEAAVDGTVFERRLEAIRTQATELEGQGPAQQRTAATVREAMNDLESSIEDLEGQSGSALRRQTQDVERQLAELEQLLGIHAGE